VHNFKSTASRQPYRTQCPNVGQRMGVGLAHDRPYSRSLQSALGVCGAIPGELLGWHVQAPVPIPEVSHGLLGLISIQP
jgi:hypothetical protein